MKTLALLLTVMISCGFLPPRIKDTPYTISAPEGYVEETTDRVDEQTGLEPIVEEAIPEGIIDDGFIAETTDRIGCTIEPVTDNSTSFNGLLPVIAIYIPEEERTGLEPIIEEEIPDDAFVEETGDFF